MQTKLICNLKIFNSDLVGCSSIFCATMATIDQLKSESVADIFQVVKAMRVQLPGAITNKVNNSEMEYNCCIYSLGPIQDDSFNRS